MKWIRTIEKRLWMPALFMLLAVGLAACGKADGKVGADTDSEQAFVSDAEGASDAEQASDAEGASDAEQASDAAGASDMSGASDAVGASDAAGATDAGGKEGSGEDSDTARSTDSAEKTELVILAAASLTDVCEQLKAEYEASHEDVTLIFSYGSSGALQTQIEEGAPADLFFSASTKQMDALTDEDLMDRDSVTQLLENKVVLVVPADGTKDIAAFEDLAKDEVEIIGLGDPESVPAGQYAQEVFTTLGIWDAVQAKANLGTDVRTVLSWVEEGEVDCGVVYATDAGSTDRVKVVAQALEGSCKKVVYPVGITAEAADKAEIREFLEYLKSDAVLNVFESYGFSRVE